MIELQFIIVLLLICIFLISYNLNDLFQSILGRLIIFLLLILIAGFNFRYENIEHFLQSANYDPNASYPFIANVWDIGGHMELMMQAFIDPISLSNFKNLSLFSISEACFFSGTVFFGLFYLKSSSLKAASLMAAIFLALIIFAYFETFVSGFARHRFGLIILLLAVISNLYYLQGPSILNCKSLELAAKK